MRRALFLATLTWVSSAAAEDARTAPTPSRAAEVRRDPQGVIGVSPFWEKLVEGDGAVLARNFDGAIRVYREAIAANPQNALGHYRVAQAYVLKGDLKEAEVAYTAALRFVGNDGTLKGKVLFCLADLRERQRLHDEAIVRWNEYETHARADEKAKTHPASAAERKKRNEEWKALAAESAEVKSRIEKRLKEAEDTARRRAK
jgi:tetratricopeptide (TPR) repeat protein